MFRSKLLTSCLIVGFGLTLSACQTAQSLRAQFIANSYEDINGKFIDEAPNHVVDELEENLATKMLDDFQITDNGEEVGFNISERIRQRESREAKLTMGLTALEVERSEVRKDNFVELEGPGVEKLHSYIRSILKRLERNWPHADLSPELTLSIVDDETYNASMSSLNVMRVYLGVLLNSQSEDELAAILAHELAHGFLKHHNAQDWKAVENKALSAAILSAASHLGDNGASENTLTALMMADKGLRRLNNKVLYPAWGRHLEDHADLVAVDLLVGAGYNWMALLTVLERIGDQDRKLLAMRAAQEQKLEQERQFAAQNGTFSQAFNASVETLKVKLGNLSSDLSKEHADSEDRLNNVSGYTRREYRRTRVPAQRTEAYAQAIFKGQGLQVIKKRVYIRDAEKAYESNNLDEAAALGLKALDSGSDPDPRVRKLLHDVRLAQGNPNGAIKNLEIARRGGQANLNIYDLLVERYLEQQEWQKAKDIWVERNQAFALSAYEVLPKLIELNVLGGDMKAANTVLQSCVAQSENAPRLATLCQMSFERGLEKRRTLERQTPGSVYLHAHSDQTG